MKASDDTRQYSPKTLKAERARGKTRTRADAPARPVDDDFWRNARVVMPPPGKASVHLRVDADVLHWFRGRGKKYQTYMNEVLRREMQTKHRQQ